MLDIETKEDNNPLVHTGKRFAYEDNSVHRELRNLILPFTTLDEGKDFQVIASTKAVSWMSGYSVVTGVPNNIVIVAGVNIADQDVPLKHGMRFSFKSFASNTDIVTAKVNWYPYKRVLLDGNELAPGFIVPNAEYMIEYNGPGDYYEIVVSACMREQINAPRYALWQGEQDVIFRVNDPINDFDAVNLRTLNAALDGLVAAPGSVEYTIPGDYTFTIPRGVTSIDVFGIAGGGGGIGLTTTTNTTTTTNQWVARAWSNHGNDWEYRYYEDADSNDCAYPITAGAELNIYYYTKDGVFYGSQITNGTVSAVEGTTSATLGGYSLRRGAYVGTSNNACSASGTDRKHYVVEVYEPVTSGGVVTTYKWYGGNAGQLMDVTTRAVTPGDIISLTVGAGGSHDVDGTNTVIDGTVLAGGGAGLRTYTAATTRVTPLGTFTSPAAVGQARGGQAGMGNGGSADSTPINPTGYGSGGGGFDPANVNNAAVQVAATGRDGYINISWGN